MLWIYARHPTRTTDIKFNPINHIDMKTKLSPYTIASNCTDLYWHPWRYQWNPGRNEKACFRRQNVPSFFYSRLSKLQTKRKKIWTEKPDSHECDHPFFIDEETLTMAVHHCLYFQIEPSFPNVKKAIEECNLEQRKIHHRFPQNPGVMTLWM